MKVNVKTSVSIEMNGEEFEALKALVGNTSENDRGQYVSEGQARLLGNMWEPMADVLSD